MLLQRDRTREAVRGLANLFVRELSPSLETVYSDIGWLSDDGTTIDPQAQVIEHKDEGGNLTKVSIGDVSHKLTAHLAQVSQDEIDLIVNSAGKTHSVRYYGMMNPWRFQYKCAELVQIVPYIPRTWKAGKQNLPLTAFFLKQDNSVFDTPEYYDAEAMGPLHLENCNLWLSPRRKFNDATSRILDISGFAKHAVLSQTSGGIAGIWQSATHPERFLRFGGVDGVATLGDVLDLGVDGAIVEFWLRVQAADGTLQEVITKKASNSQADAGFWIERSTGNKIKIYYSDGSTQHTLTSSVSVLQNVWTHVLINFDRTIGTYIYFNGVLDLNEAPLETSMSNAVNLYVGRGGTGYGQIDVGDVRVHLNANGFTNPEMISLDHYNAEKTYYPNS